MDDSIGCMSMSAAEVERILHRIYHIRTSAC